MKNMPAGPHPITATVGWVLRVAFGDAVIVAVIVVDDADAIAAALSALWS
jgi:hypothetical protein